MEEEKSFDDFYAKLKDIVNSTFNLGETIPKHILSLVEGKRLQVEGKRLQGLK